LKIALPAALENLPVKIMLYPSQAKQFWPLLVDGLNRTGISGILCTINRSQDLNDGHLFWPAGSGGDPKNPASNFREPAGVKIK
jgi:hypothetical protein